MSITRAISKNVTCCLQGLVDTKATGPVDTGRLFKVSKSGMYRQFSLKRLN